MFALGRLHCSPSGTEPCPACPWEEQPEQTFLRPISCKPLSTGSLSACMPLLNTHIERLSVHVEMPDIQVTSCMCFCKEWGLAGRGMDAEEGQCALLLFPGWGWGSPCPASRMAPGSLGRPHAVSGIVSSCCTNRANVPGQYWEGECYLFLYCVYFVVVC